MGEASPGQALRLLLEIEATNGPVAGFYLTADAGGLSPIAGQGTQVLGSGIAHSSPKSGSGFVRFEIDWIAPAEPAGVVFRVWAVSANNNKSSGGDGGSTTTLAVVSGCEGEPYFRDGDRDGYGSATFGMRLDCAQREGYTTVEGDCDENNAAINPSVEEYCNEHDDDCDGVVDEGSLPQAHYPDPDGDGHGQPGSESVLECPPPPSYAPSDDDCLEGDDGAYPGATEVCDGHDNDCDNQADERVKPACGVGWCRRESWSCNESDCTPGEPRAEECNAFDDDCDDVLDEGVDCGAGLECQAGYCVPEGTVLDAGTAPPVDPTGPSDPGDPIGPPPPAANVDAGVTTPAASGAAGGCSIASARSRTPVTLYALGAIALSIAGRRRHRRVH